MSAAAGRCGPADLAEWVRYLRDIGVRELSVAAVAASNEIEAPKPEPGPQPVVGRAVVPATLPTLQVGGAATAEMDGASESEHEKDNGEKARSAAQTPDSRSRDGEYGGCSCRPLVEGRPDASGPVPSVRQLHSRCP